MLDGRTDRVAEGFAADRFARNATASLSAFLRTTTELSIVSVEQCPYSEFLLALPDPPSYSAVRAMLRILEEKGHVRHEEEGSRYVFMPTVRRDTAKRSALKHLVNTFFDGSASQVMAALVDLSARDLDDEELRRLRALIEEAEKGRKP